MKKIVGLFLLVIAVGVVIISQNQIKKETFTESAAKERKVSGYDYSLLAVSDLEKLKLISNYRQKLTSAKFLENNQCLFLVNGGFYSTDNQPLGLFITEGKTLNNFNTSLLFNGVLSVNDLLTPRITRTVPQDPLRLAVQAGPLLIENGQTLKLILKSDQPARRVVAAVSGENKLYFLAVYSSEQLFNGPNLKDLPEIVTEIGKKENLGLADALNLDGGTASVFIGAEVKLNELTPVGSFFCQLSP